MVNITDDVPISIRNRFDELSRATEQLSSLQEMHDRLEGLPRELAGTVRSNFYRFVTFTARPGSPISSQLQDEAAGNRYEEHRTAASGTEKGVRDFPQLTDTALRKRVSASDDVVPDGKVRQFFCYVDRKKNAIVEFTIDIPAQLHQSGEGRHQRRTRQSENMLRLQEFALLHLSNYIASLVIERDQLLATVSDEIHHAVDSGWFEVLGMEDYISSATTMNSIGGFLIEFTSTTPPELIYCPVCAAEMIGAFEEGTQSISFPSIPNMTISPNKFCTENKHLDHGEQDCINLSEVRENVNQIRQSHSAAPFHTYNLKIVNRELAKRFGDRGWIPVD